MMLQVRASYKNESYKDDDWFNIFPHFIRAGWKITVFAMLQKQETEFHKPSLSIVNQMKLAKIWEENAKVCWEKYQLIKDVNSGLLHLTKDGFF